MVCSENRAWFPWWETHARARHLAVGLGWAGGWEAFLQGDPGLILGPALDSSKGTNLSAHPDEVPCVV